MSANRSRVVVLVVALCCCGASWCARPEGDGFDSSAERIGPLRLGMPAKEVERVLTGSPARDEEIFEGATGEHVQTWTYAKLGVSLKMSSPGKGKAKKVATVTVTTPFAGKTGKGIGIGSTEGEVARAYGRYRDAEGSVAGQKFVAGSVYDGEIFSFEKGKVVSIFLGAAAE